MMKKKLSILLISENVPPQVNGIARRVNRYVDSLRRLGHQVTLCAPTPTPSQQQQQQEKKKKKEYGHPHELNHDVHPSDCCWDYPNMFQQGNRFIVIKPRFLFECLFRRKYDVIHCVKPLNISSTILIAAFRLKRFFTKESTSTPHIVVSWHCNLSEYNRMFFPKMLQKVMGLISVPFRIMVRMGDRVLVPTASTEPMLLDHLPKESIGICETGIEINKFNPNSKYSKEGKTWIKRRRDDLRKFKKKYILLYVGRVSPEKGLADIVRAMRKLEDECVLWIVGDGPMRSTLESEVQKLDLPVTFWGYQTGIALYSVYTVCDCFVSASVTETYGQTINEALASGVQVAIPRSSGFRDAYERILDPNTCMWTPHDDKDMVRIIRGRLGINETIDRSKLITWDQATEKLVDEYRCTRRNHDVGDVVHTILWNGQLAIAVAVLTWIAAVLQGFLIARGMKKQSAMLISVILVLTTNGFVLSYALSCVLTVLANSRSGGGWFALF